jgi:transaldolase
MGDHRKNSLLQLLDQGQAVWLDSIQRGQLLSGELKKLIEEDGLRGETANPTIFEHAINDPAGDYDEQLRELIRQGLDANAIYERIATDDVRMACDLFRPLYRPNWLMTRKPPWSKYGASGKSWIGPI